MSWGKVCDTLHAHRKRAKAGHEAIGLWTAALSWSRDKGTGGHIPAGRPLLLSEDEPEPEASAARCVERLVKARLWDVDPAGGWRFHDWAEYQESEEQEAARREQISLARAEAGRRGAAVTNGKRSLVAGDNSANGGKIGNARQAAATPGKSGTSPLPSDPPPIPSPIPRSDPPVVPRGGTHPEPQVVLFGEGGPAATNPDEKPVKGAKRARAKTDMPAGWSPPESVYATGIGVGLDRAAVDRELLRFRDHHGAKGSRFADWGLAAHTWIRNVPDFQRGSGPGRPPNGAISSLQGTGGWSPRGPAPRTTS